jgi:hypothetical protein
MMGGGGGAVEREREREEGERKAFSVKGLIGVLCVCTQTVENTGCTGGEEEEHRWIAGVVLREHGSEHGCGQCCEQCVVNNMRCVTCANTPPSLPPPSCVMCDVCLGRGLYPPQTRTNGGEGRRAATPIHPQPNGMHAGSLLHT